MYDHLEELEGGVLSPDIVEEHTHGSSHVECLKHPTVFSEKPPSYVHNWVGEYKSRSPIPTIPHVVVHSSHSQPEDGYHKTKNIWRLFQSNIASEKHDKLENELAVELQTAEKQLQKKKASHNTVAFTNGAPQQQDKSTGARKEAEMIAPTVEATVKVPPVTKADVGVLANIPLNDSYDPDLLSDGLETVKGNTLDIARKLKKLEEEKTALVKEFAGDDKTSFLLTACSGCT